MDGGAAGNVIGNAIGNLEWFTAPEYATGRLVFQRALAGVYLVAFLTAALQGRALLGVRGLSPVPRYLRRVSFRQAPSLFHLYFSDRFLIGCAWAGCAVAAALLAGADRAVPLWAAMLLWLVPWALYLSIVNVGQVWYGFGWETLLLETGFLAVFLGNDEVAPPVAVLLMLRWLLFRVEFGAGLIKLRGDACWRRLTCLDHHHETQPMPGPLSWFFHHLPRPLHRVEAAANHVTQLGLPVQLFTPQPVASAAAAAMIVTQLWLIASGNFAWLNWLTITLAVPVLALPGGRSGTPDPPLWYVVVVVAACAPLVWLSRRPVANLLSRRQAMNRSYDPLRLVNTYGAFGAVSRVRHEVVVEGTAGERPDEDADWREYAFRGKPGDPRRLPRQFAPYHLRLDWLMWFVALSPAYAGSWFARFLERLLEGDRATLRLPRRSPFPPEAPPRWVRARLYRYQYTTWREWRDTGAWWVRTPVREFWPPTRLDREAEHRP